MKTTNTPAKIKSFGITLFLVISNICVSQTNIAPTPIVRLVLNGSTCSEDLTTFYFQQGGSLNFQSNFDAYKLIFNSNQPYIASVSNTVLCSIKGMPPLNSNMIMPVKAITAATGSFTFSSIKSDFPNNICVTLFDAFTGITTNILTTNYSCILYDTTSISRFKINFFTSTLSVTNNIIQPNCIIQTGILTSKGNNSGPWNYEWRDSNNAIIKTSLNKTTVDSLTVLPGGNYSVKVNSVGQCDSYQQTFTINAISTPIANFSINNYTIYLASGQINFTNLSSNAQTSYWDFGDTYGNSSSNNPVYTYTQAGVYSVKLIVQNNLLCSDTITKQLTVLNTTGIKYQLPNDNALLLYDNVSGNYTLKFNYTLNSSLLIALYDLNGKQVLSEICDANSTQSLLINTSIITKGIYLLKIISEEKEITVFKIVK
ncbi:MAG: T9SS type A sorting domain-containing protein [Bacteroidia bacterium]|nr:T9SS type A sorting domain-containing protein [Bacteroidia bacterium]